jgi:hypothetical protein
LGEAIACARCAAMSASLSRSQARAADKKALFGSGRLAWALM